MSAPRGRKIHGGGKNCNFRHTSPFISKTTRDRPTVTVEVMVADRYVSVPMTLKRPNPDFKVTNISKKTVRFRVKVTIEH